MTGVWARNVLPGATRGFRGIIEDKGISRESATVKKHSLLLSNEASLKGNLRQLGSCAGTKLVHEPGTVELYGLE